MSGSGGPSKSASSELSSSPGWRPPRLPDWLRGVRTGAFNDDSTSLPDWLTRHCPDVQVVAVTDAADPVHRAYPELAPADRGAESVNTPLLVVVADGHWECWRPWEYWERPWAQMGGLDRAVKLLRVVDQVDLAGQDRFELADVLCVYLAEQVAVGHASPRHPWRFDNVWALDALTTLMAPAEVDGLLLVHGFNGVAADLQELLTAHRMVASRLGEVPEASMVLAEVEQAEGYQLGPLAGSDPNVSALRGTDRAAALSIMLTVPREQWTATALTALTAIRQLRNRR